MDDIKNKLIEMISMYKNIHILDNEIYHYNDILFIGSTLWSFIPDKYIYKIKKEINDYKYVYKNNKRINPNDTNLLHQESIKFIQDEINNNLDKKIIIITHHAPQIKETSYSEYIGSYTNHAFSTDLSFENEDKIKLWCFGHTHHNIFLDNKYKLLSNQFGYIGEHTGITYKFDLSFNL
jgi:hypothetical protein